jgi:hypothetical protein
MVTIVTGASENHGKSLIQLLNSIRLHAPTVPVVAFDYGLHESTRNYINTQFPTVTLRRFPFEGYPSYFDIRVNAGEYAWKPVSIAMVAEEYGGIVLWCDAGNILTGSLEPIVDVIVRQGIYSPISAGTVGQWTHPGTLAWFHAPLDVLTRPPRNGAILGWDVRNPRIMDVLRQFVACALQKDCIAPEGSNRSNHRQEQAVFTLLYYSCMGSASDFIEIASDFE